MSRIVCVGAVGRIEHAESVGRAVSGRRVDEVVIRIDVVDGSPTAIDTDRSLAGDPPTFRISPSETRRNEAWSMMPDERRRIVGELAASPRGEVCAR